MALSKRWAAVTNSFGPIAKAVPTRSFAPTATAGARNSKVAPRTTFSVLESSAGAACVCRIPSRQANSPCNIAFSIRRASVASGDQMFLSEAVHWPDRLQTQQPQQPQQPYVIHTLVATSLERVRNFADLWGFAKQQSDRPWSIAGLRSLPKCGFNHVPTGWGGSAGFI